MKDDSLRPGKSHTLNIESFNTSLLDNLTTAVVVLDDKFSLYHLNPAAEALLETSDKHRHNAHISELLRGSEEFINALNNVLESQNTLINRKVTMTLANGNKITVDYSASTVNDLGETYILLELQELNRSYRISRKEALLSNHGATLELVRGLSHEIKNPLGGIRGAAQLLALELPGEHLQDYTNVIIEETDRLVNLVDRLTGSYQKPSIKQVNIHEVLERVRNLVEAETAGTIELIRDYDPSIPEIEGDFEQLIQATLNITRNAMQALTESDMGDKKPQIILKTRTASHVTIGPELHKKVARIEIIDNGPGIPQEIAETIFYPLISGRAEGTGLGLSIAQSVLNNHQGLIECDSQEGLTRFILSIPFPVKELQHDN